MHALVASPYKSAYNAAKHGIAGFTKTVALELAQTGITCNAICPGGCSADGCLHAAMWPPCGPPARADPLMLLR
jgi:NAD(P)-dependent dehydrogenase (short-subunit alcohol dehydrogenase family)